jgi:hypothetical protein
MHQAMQRKHHACIIIKIRQILLFSRELLCSINRYNEKEFDDLILSKSYKDLKSISKFTDYVIEIILI